MLGFNGVVNHKIVVFFSRCFLNILFSPREPIFPIFGLQSYESVTEKLLTCATSQVGSWRLDLLTSRMEVPTAEELWRTKQGGLWRPEHGVVRCQCWCNWKIGELPSWFQDGHGVLVKIFVMNGDHLSNTNCWLWSLFLLCFCLKFTLVAFFGVSVTDMYSIYIVQYMAKWSNTWTCFLAMIVSTG